MAKSYEEQIEELKRMIIALGLEDTKKIEALEKRIDELTAILKDTAGRLGTVGKHKTGKSDK